MILDKIELKGEELKFLEGHDRLQYLMDQSKDTDLLDDVYKTDENKIRGCVSNLWVVGKVKPDNTMSYNHDADSHMTKGTAKVILDMVNNEPREEVSKLNLDSFKKLGIKELFTMQRQMGFASLIERVIQIAK
jgi:cysteine desulfuration protein SufE